MMVLNEAPAEKIRHTWYSRLAQERRELSASVEEALVSIPLDESFWMDDLSQSATSIGTEHDKNVFPPRLSLQSRSLPGTSASVGKGLISTHRDTERHPGIWKRFAQRLTSSLVAFCFHPPETATEATSILPPPATQDDALSQPASAKDIRQVPVGNGDASNNRVVSIMTSEGSRNSECRVLAETAVRHGSSSAPHAAHNIQGRQRLAGRTTRIRLEVVPDPSTPKGKHALESQKVPDTLSKDCINHEKVLANACTPIASPLHAYHDVTSTSKALSESSAFFNEGGATSVRLPAVEKAIRRPLDDRSSSEDESGTTSIRLPIVEKRARIAKQPLDDHPRRGDRRETTSTHIPVVETGVKRQAESAPDWHVGTGMFECGQRDVTISDPSVMASSVVLVMLTANPGPVVVQYVSLQPQNGFTVHLTAPTTMGAPFNYIMLNEQKR